MSSGQSHLLCVDDEQAVLNQLSAQLTRRFGKTQRVECAESAEEALALMAEIAAAGDEVAVVICDQVMPGMKGDRFLQTVHERWPDVMKVLLTGQAGLEAAVHAINHAGLHRYIEKPWEAEDLLLAVSTLLDQHRLRRELRRYHERLLRRDRDLRALHALGREMAGLATVEDVVGAAAAAARALVADALAVAAVARSAEGDARWAGEPERVSPALARDLAERLAEATDPPSGGAASVFPLDHGERRFGFLVVERTAPLAEDGRDLLSILAGQTAARLRGLELTREAVRAERLTTVGRMITSVVHDLRNPMTTIKGYAEVLATLGVPEERRQACARVIVEETARMNGMLEEVLEFTRGEAPRLHLAPVTTADLVESVHRLVAPDFAQRRVAFEAEVAEGGSVLVDVERLKRALLNLTSNAAEAMPDGGTFRVQARRADGHVELLLSDTGRGIPPQALPRIFEPFFTYGKARGIGLGTAIARRIVEDHGGTIAIDSAPGEGTRVTIRLPVPSAPDAVR